MENQEQIIQQTGGSSRSFVILVAVLGGLLVLGIGAFVAWALVVAPRMRADIEARNETVFATNTAVALAAAATETAAVPPTATNTLVPTEPPPPTETPTPRPATATPEPTATFSFETPEAEDEAESGGMPETGVGILGGALMAGGLAALLVLVRRLRSTDLR